VNRHVSGIPERIRQTAISMPTTHTWRKAYPQRDTEKDKRLASSPQQSLRLQLQNVLDFLLARVTDGSIKTLSILTSLRELDLNRTKISAKGKSEIRKSLPGCKVKS
jgi:hypothetical protein